MPALEGDQLAGRIAAITGAAGGFGRELVFALLREGAAVTALDIDERRLQTLSDECSERGLPARLATFRMD
ncbi:MAG: SDR family NAD(P)-dependent oxidoreductase, partial [Gammaproteobacteria bacterium]|nr:SDR family NAD(P)-dependent oxidoreductase [Gammaproteobacteria bacterium]